MVSIPLGDAPDDVGDDSRSVKRLQRVRGLGIARPVGECETLDSLEMFHIVGY